MAVTAERFDHSTERDRHAEATIPGVTWATARRGVRVSGEHVDGSIWVDDLGQVDIDDLGFRGGAAELLELRAMVDLAIKAAAGATRERRPMVLVPNHQRVLALQGDQVVTEVVNLRTQLVVSQQPAADHGYRPSLPLELRPLALAAARATA